MRRRRPSRAGGTRWARTTRSSAVRPDSMIRSKSWRTSCRKPRVCRAAPRSSGQGSSRPGSACPSSSSLMIRSCSGPGEELRRARQRQDAFRLGAPDQIERVRRPGAGRRRTEAPVQPCGEAVPEGIRGEPPGCQDQHPFRVQPVPLGPADGGLHQDGGFSGARRPGHQDGAGAVRDVDGGELVRGQHRAPRCAAAAGGSSAAPRRGPVRDPPEAGSGSGRSEACRSEAGGSETGSGRGYSHSHFIIRYRQFMQRPLQPLGDGVDPVEVASAGAHRAAARSTRQRPSPVRR